MSGAERHSVSWRSAPLGWSCKNFQRRWTAHLCCGIAVPSQYQSLARYVAKDVVSPPISVRRIDRYDGERVTYHYRSHRTERVEHETVEVATFIGRMVQHTVPKGFSSIYRSL